MSHEPPREYRMKYSLTFREVRPAEQISRVDMIVLNAVAWPQVEYQLPDALGPNSTHMHVGTPPKITLQLILHLNHARVGHLRLIRLSA